MRSFRDMDVKYKRKIKRGLRMKKYSATYHEGSAEFFICGKLVFSFDKITLARFKVLEERWTA